LHARLINAQDGTVVWAENRERSGNDGRVLFDYGAIHGLGKLTKTVIRGMISNMPLRSRIEKQPLHEPITHRP